MKPDTDVFIEIKLAHCGKVYDCALSVEVDASSGDSYERALAQGQCYLAHFEVRTEVGGHYQQIEDKPTLNALRKLAREWINNNETTIRAKARI